MNVTKMEVLIWRKTLTTKENKILSAIVNYILNLQMKSTFTQTSNAYKLALQNPSASFFWKFRN